MKTSDQLKEMLEAQPQMTAAIAAATLGVSRQRISQIVKAFGLKIRDGREDKATMRDRQWKNHWGGDEKLPSHFIGGASELIVGADLLRRGIPVFRAITFVCSCDLVADFSGRLVRIEVRSGRRREDGRLAFPPAKVERYDVLAVVDQAGIVTYRPKEGVEWVE